MPYQIQSDSSGQVYDFEDDVPLAKASEYIHSVEKQPSYGEVATKALENMGATTKARGAQLAAGVKRIAGEVVGNQDWVNEAESVQKLAEQDMAEMAPKNMSWTQEGLYSGITQLPENLMTVAAGALGAVARGATVGRAALANGSTVAAEALKGAKVALLPMAGSEAIHSYGESRALGQDVLPAAAGAAVHGAAEYFGEVFSAKPMADILSGTGGTKWLLNNLARYFGREIAGEEMTTLVQSANTAVRDGKSLGEWVDGLPKEMFVTGVATGVSGGGQTALLGGVSKAADMLSANEKQPTPVPSTATPAPVDDSALPPEPVGKTRLVEPMVLDPETGKFVPANSLNINRQELPFDQRLELLRMARRSTDQALNDLLNRENEIRQRVAEWDAAGPGFAATAEDLIEKRRAAEEELKQIEPLKAQALDLQAQYEAQRDRFDEEIKNDPTLLAHTTERDFIDGVLSGSIRDGLTVDLVQAAAGNDISSNLAEMTMRALVRGDITKEQMKALVGDIALSPSFITRLDTMAAATNNISPSSTAPENILGTSAETLGFPRPLVDQVARVAEWQQQTVAADSNMETSPLIGMDGGKAYAAMAPGQVITTLSKFDAKDQKQVARRKAFNESRVASEVNNAVASWVRTFAPDVKVIISYDPAGKHGHSSIVTLDKGVFVMELPYPPEDVMNADKGNASRPNTSWWSTLVAAHEFGHLLHLHVLANASLDERRALGMAYLSDLQKLEDLNFSDGLKLLFGPGRYSHVVDHLGHWAQLAHVPTTTLMQMPFYEAYKKTQMGTKWGSRHYVLTANEWFAEQMVKYVTERSGVAQEIRPIIERVVMKLADLYRRFVSKLVHALKGVADTITDAEVRKHVEQVIKANETFAAYVDSVAFKSGTLHDLTRRPGDRPMDVLGLQGIATGSKAVDIPTVRDYIYAQELAQAGVQYNPAQVKEVFSSLLNNLFPRLAKIHNVISAKTMLAHVEQMLGTTPYAKALAQSTKQMLQEPMFAKPFAVSTFIPRFINDVLNIKATSVISSTEDNAFYSDVAISRPWHGIQGKAKEAGFTVKRYAGDNMAIIMADSVSSESEALAVALTALPIVADSGAKYVDLSTTNPLLTIALQSFGTQIIKNKAGEAKMLIPTWAYSDDNTIAFGQPLHNALANLGQHFGIPAMHSFSHATARFNTLMKYALGAFQIIKKNMHLPGIPEAKQALLNRMGYRAEWQRKANQTLAVWTDLPKDQANKVAKLLLDEAEAYEAALSPAAKVAAWQSTKAVDPQNPNRFVYVPTQAAMQRYGLSQEAAELYSTIRGDYQEFLDEMHKVGLYEIADLRMGRAPALAIHEAMQRKATIGEINLLIDAFLQQTANPAVQQEVNAARKELSDQYTALAAKPYTPFARFGQWGVLVKRPQDKKTVYFATFESEKEQQAHAREIAKDPRFANHGITTTYIEDLPYSLAGLPPAIASSLKSRLNLSQQQAKELDEVLAGYMSSNSFVRKMGKRHGIEGYSEDVMRGYADYFRRGATYITNTKSKMEMADALGLLKKYITEVQNQPGFHDTRKLARLHEWLEKSFDYAMHPDSEPGALKSFVSMFHFGFNASSAFVNMLQVPLATLPYLAQRHGWLRALGELKKAYTDVVSFKGWADLPPEEQAMVEYGLSQGSFDESLAMNVAQLADGYYLTRASTFTATRRILNKTNHVALWMFRSAEELNRRVTALATYRLERQDARVSQQATGNFDMDAYSRALDAVQDTQGEYAVENRPVFMRGNLSAIFQFMQFSQNMTFQMFGGDRSWKKLMLVQLAIAGVMGMPFGSDAAELVKLLGRLWFGKDWNVDYEVRKYLQDSAVSPDLILRGLSSDVFGYDLSQRVSLGDLVPGLKAAASHRKFRDVMADATSDIGGPGISLILNAMRFIGEDDPRLLHRFQMIAPSALRNVLRGIEAEINGGVKDRDGALLYDPDIWHKVGYSAGFLPKELSDKYAERSAVGEAATFWTHRRQVLLEELRYSVLQKGNDREAVSDVMDAIAKYNRDAPDPKLFINRKTILSSMKSEVKSVAQREAGFGSNPQTRVLASQMSQAY